MVQLDWAYQFDWDLLDHNMAISASAMARLMAAKQAWSEFSRTACDLESVPDADRGYDHRMAHPAF